MIVNKIELLIASIRDSRLVALVQQIWQGRDEVIDNTEIEMEPIQNVPPILEGDIEPAEQQIIVNRAPSDIVEAGE